LARQLASSPFDQPKYFYFEESSFRSGLAHMEHMIRVQELLQKKATKDQCTMLRIEKERLENKERMLDKKSEEWKETKRKYEACLEDMIAREEALYREKVRLEHKDHLLTEKQTKLQQDKLEFESAIDSVMYDLSIDKEDKTKAIETRKKQCVIM